MHFLPAYSLFTHLFTFYSLIHFLLAIKSGLGVKSGLRLKILFTLGLLLLWWKLTFYFMSYPLLEFHGTYSVPYLLFFWPIKSTLYSVFYLMNKYGPISLSLKSEQRWVNSNLEIKTSPLLHFLLPHHPPPPLTLPAFSQEFLSIPLVFIHLDISFSKPKLPFPLLLNWRIKWPCWTIFSKEEEKLS